MKRRFPFYAICSIAIILTSNQVKAMELKTVSKFIFTDLLHKDVEGEIRYKISCDEIGAVIEDKKDHRLPTEQEAQEICQRLDEKYLCGIYSREDFEFTYQAFWISDKLSEQLQIYCPLQKHDTIKEPAKGETCCLRLVFEPQLDTPIQASKIAELGEYAFLCISPNCTWKNAVLGVIAVGVGGAGMYSLKYLHETSKFATVIAVANNVLGFRQRIADFYQICREQCAHLFALGNVLMKSLPVY